jgi:hypothetical protein
MALYVNVSMVTQQGDIGGVGMSRFHCETAAGLAVAPADITAWHNALRTLYNSQIGSIPSDITYHVAPQVQVLEVSNAALIQNLVNPSPPAAVVCAGAGNYAAGTGCRINWQTGTVKNRRLIRGATFLNPLALGGYTSGGAISGSFESALATALVNYLNSMSAAGLVPVIYSRPTKAAPETGADGAITGATVSVAPSSLRSRRA